MSDPQNHADAVPPGWDYNPASWSQRLPIVGAALVGFAIAMYLALYQWGVFDRIFEPFFSEDGIFGGGSKKILKDSGISQKTMSYIGVPDAFLGAVGYFADAVAGILGGVERWRTMPWIVIIFAILIGPLGLVSLLLVVAQPVLYDAWCTLCLATAFISVVMIGPSMDEALATLQYLHREKRRGNSVWRAFWGLGDRSSEPQDEHTRRNVELAK